MPNLGFGEILVVLLIALVLFGGRLPEVGRSLGQAMHQFKEGVKDSARNLVDEDDEDEEEEQGDEEETPASPGTESISPPGTT